MRKTALLLTVIFLLAALCMPAFAADDVERAMLTATVDEKGACQVTLIISFRMEQMDRTMRYPLPADATDIMLNGSPVGTYQAGAVQQVDLSGVISTDAQKLTCTLQYTLPDVVSGEQVQIPLLSGFQLPVSALDFTVRLPADIAGKPAFTSTYHQSDIEKDLSWSYAGDTITGRSLSQIKDYETLLLLIPVNSGMFSRSAVALFNSNAGQIGMWVCLALALIYWLFFLRTGLPKSQRCTQPPQGCTAGDMASILTLEGTDLSLLVLSWAQMGYVILERERSGKVLIHYAMGMGNERSDSELRIFNRLFSKRSVVDTASLQYARLYKDVAAHGGYARVLAHSQSGNPRIFRLLSSLAGLFCGMHVAFTLPVTGFLQVLLVFVFCVIGFLCAQGIHLGTQGLLLWRPYRLRPGIGYLIGWLLLCLLCGSFTFGILTALMHLLLGILGTYGGRRTEEGKRNFSQVMGLRKHLRRISRETAEQLINQDPDFFHNTIPCALALGVDNVFAKHFDRKPLPPCPYVIGVPGGEHTAQDYVLLYRSLVSSMNARYRQLTKEQFGQVLRNIRR